MIKRRDDVHRVARRLRTSLVLLAAPLAIAAVPQDFDVRPVLYLDLGGGAVDRNLLLLDWAVTHPRTLISII